MNRSNLRKRRQTLVGWLCLPALHTGAVALGMHLLAASASAQTPGRVPGDDSGMIQWAIAAGLVLVVCATGFLPAKRSHLT